MEMSQQEINELEISFYEYFIQAENPDMEWDEVAKLALKMWKEEKQEIKENVSSNQLH